MKKCIKCLIEKSSNEFESRRNQCKKCRNEYSKSKAKLRRYSITLTEKICINCKTNKPAKEFSVNRRALGGLNNTCRICRAENHIKEYEINAEYYREKSKEYYQKIRGTEEFKAKNRERQAKKVATDPKYKLTRRLRNRLYYALKKKSWKKNTKFATYIGCTLDELKSHLEKQFIEGMSWDNHGEWHIDHIIPLDSAETEERLYELCHYTNLQPMWATDNIKKGTKV